MENTNEMNRSLHQLHKRMHGREPRHFTPEEGSFVMLCRIEKELKQLVRINSKNENTIAEPPAAPRVAWWKRLFYR